MNSIWKPTKNKTQYTNIQHLQNHGQKATRKKLNYLQNIFPKFSLHIIMIRTRKWNQDLATPIQSQNSIKAFTLKEKKELKMLNQKKRHQVSTSLLPEY